MSTSGNTERTYADCQEGQARQDSDEIYFYFYLA